MPSSLEIGLYVFMLATFLGLEVIRKVSPLLHTPLMSLTNAISAISVVGAILITGSQGATTLSKVLGFIAITAAVFVLSLKWMNSPATARRGVFAGETGMLLAVTGTLLAHEVFNWQWILAALLIGTAVGVPIAYIMPMTAVPQRTAMSHACGALAAALVGTAEFYREPQ